MPNIHDVRCLGSLWQNNNEGKTIVVRHLYTPKTVLWAPFVVSWFTLLTSKFHTSLCGDWLALSYPSCLPNWLGTAKDKLEDMEWELPEVSQLQTWISNLSLLRSEGWQRKKSYKFRKLKRRLSFHSWYATLIHFVKTLTIIIHCSSGFRKSKAKYVQVIATFPFFSNFQTSAGNVLSKWWVLNTYGNERDSSTIFCTC